MALEVQNLKKSFGGVKAVDCVSFTAYEGEITCITGKNGAGKTTVFNILTGFCTPDEGRVLLDGRDITHMSAPARARAGVARTFQNIRLLDEMSVLENLLTAMHTELNGSIIDTVLPTARRKRTLEYAKAYARKQLELLGLSQYADMPTGSMPYGARKLLEIARCLCMKPRVMLLDEPASGLNGQEAMHLGDTILGLDRSDTIIIVIEHNMTLVKQIADRIIYMDGGLAHSVC